ncbi:hypothetical protein HZB04_01485 [Candidatus Wolfebacteria bacterium]|nr:hypothetical protein [Candidatus Wolfebacteria bacterium]
MNEANEIDVIIDNAISGLEGENIDKKIMKIFTNLGVHVVKEEIEYGKEVLKAIIKGRIIDRCPKCHGFGFKNLRDKEKCPICKGKGYITAIEVEKNINQERR